MLPYTFYKVMHIFGILMMFGGLVALWGLYTNGGKVTKQKRVQMALIHGFGMTFILVSGFGMMARLGLINGMPKWVIAKIFIWLFFGASIVLAKRKAHLGISLLGMWMAVGTLAAYFAIYKPF